MAIETPKSPVVPIFLVIFFLGFLLTAAGGGYLYFRWESHFPPLADLQKQVKAARATSEAEEEAEKDLNRTGIPEWTEDLSDQYSNRANDMAKRMERDLAKAQAAAETTENGIRSNQPRAPMQGRTDIAAIQQALAEQRASTETGAALTEIVTEEVDVDHLESGGSIEKMNDDWLPPGVSKSE